jgi:hypothetical protein
MKITLEDALSLLGKYVDERTPVLAVFVTPSVSIARVTGLIHISVVDVVGPHLIVGKDDGASDQIKFRLSDCEFSYGDFRDASAEDFGADKFEGFLVVGSSKGDALSLFEMKTGAYLTSDQARIAFGLSGSRLDSFFTLV